MEEAPGDRAERPRAGGYCGRTGKRRAARSLAALRGERRAGHGGRAETRAEGCSERLEHSGTPSVGSLSDLICFTPAVLDWRMILFG